MVRDLICPDCGGRIGGTGSDGHAPCRCFHPEPERRGTEADEADATPAEPTKLCHVCGKNLKGHRRLRDSRGYMCLACARAEQLAREAQEADRVPCAECGRKLKPEGLIEFGGLRICKLCHEHHREMARTKRAPIHSTHHDEHERQRVKWLAGVLGVLLLIALLRWLLG